MNIQIKNIYTNERFSEETNCFRCDIYLDGKKVGYADNEGNGGCTNYGAYKLEDRILIVAMEEYCKTLPPTSYVFRGETNYIDTTLENFIDDAIEKHLEAKFKKKVQAKLEKDCAKGICYGDNNGYRILEFKLGKNKIALKDVLMTPRGIEYVKKSCEDLIAKGNTIMNKNLPFTI